MANQGSKQRERLWNIYNYTAKSIPDLSDAEFRKEVEIGGGSVTELAGRGRAIIESVIKMHRQKALIAARVELQRARLKITSNKITAGITPAQRRSIFQSLMKKRPDIGPGMLTSQYRNFSELPDADIESALEQMFTLGIWDGKIPNDPESES